MNETPRHRIEHCRHWQAHIRCVNWYWISLLDLNKGAARCHLIPPTALDSTTCTAAERTVPMRRFVCFPLSQDRPVTRRIRSYQ